MKEKIFIGLSIISALPVLSVATLFGLDGLENIFSGDLMQIFELLVLLLASVGVAGLFMALWVDIGKANRKSTFVIYTLFSGFFAFILGSTYILHEAVHMKKFGTPDDAHTGQKLFFLWLTAFILSIGPLISSYMVIKKYFNQ